MPSEPSDSGWFTPAGRHYRESAETPSPTPAAPAGEAYGQPYGQAGTHPPASSYSAPTTHGQAGPGTVPPAPAPTPPPYQPPSGYQPPAAYPPPTTYPASNPPVPATYQPPGPQAPPPPQGAPPPAPQPGAGAQPGVRQPTGDYPTQWHPGGLAPGRRPPPTVAHPQVGRPPAGPGGRAPENGHGHSHLHTADFAVSKHTKAIIRWILIPCALATAIAMVLLWPAHPGAQTPVDEATQRAYGRVVQIAETPCPDGELGQGPVLPCGRAAVRIESGTGAGQTVTVDLPNAAGSPRLSVGDDVVLGYFTDPGGGEGTYGVMDLQRGNDLLIMVAICAIAVIAFGRLRGVTALIGLAVSFAILLLFIIPAVLTGASPLLVAIVGSAAIMFAVLYLTHGFSVHTSVAVLGTLASLVVTGLLGALFTATTSLTGSADETSLYLSYLDTTIDLRGLLLAGIIIGALGVLDDVTVTQASTVAELARTSSSRLEVYRAAIRVGRDHVASAVNTLVLAYAGASLPLLLLLAAGSVDISDVLTTQLIAQEIVRAAVGTIGLVAAVPITTALGALVADVRHDTRADPSRADGRPGARPDRRPDRRPDYRDRPDRPEPDYWAEAVTGR